MGRRAISEQQHRQLLESFRTDPEPGSHASYRRAAEAAGVDPRTARRAFKVGWPGVKPIRELIESEKTLSRAALRREVLASRLDEASRLAADDALESRVMEGRAVRTVTTSATNALVALHMAKIQDFEVVLAKLMQDPVNPGSPVALAARRAFSDIAGIVSKLTEAAERGQRMCRLLLGEPSVVLGGELSLRPAVAPNADAATLVTEIQAAQRALDELRQLEARKDKSDAQPGNGLSH
jgi:hypothetical protein